LQDISSDPTTQIQLGADEVLLQMPFPVNSAVRWVKADLAPTQIAEHFSALRCGLGYDETLTSLR